MVAFVGDKFRQLAGKLSELKPTQPMYSEHNPVPLQDKTITVLHFKSDGKFHSELGECRAL